MTELASLPPQAAPSLQGDSLDSIPTLPPSADGSIQGMLPPSMQTPGTQDFFKLLDKIKEKTVTEEKYGPPENKKSFLGCMKVAAVLAVIVALMNLPPVQAVLTKMFPKVSMRLAVVAVFTFLITTLLVRKC